MTTPSNVPPGKMRAIPVVLGVVFIVLGAVLMFVPLVKAGSQAVTTTNPYAANVTGFSITGTVPGSLTWSSNSPVSVVAGSCTTLQFTGNVNSPCPGFILIGAANGTGGSMSFNIKPGSTLFFAISSGNAASQATVTVAIAQGTIGLLVLILGVVLVLYGVVRKRKTTAQIAPIAPPTPSD